MRRENTYEDILSKIFSGILSAVWTKVLYNT
jgi:hypothetical protein